MSMSYSVALTAVPSLSPRVRESNERFLKTLRDVTSSNTIAQKVLHSGVSQAVQLRNGLAFCRKLPKGNTKEILHQVGSHFLVIRQTLALLANLKTANSLNELSKADKHDLYYCLAQCYASKGCRKEAIWILDKILSCISDPKESVEKKRYWAHVIALRAFLVTDLTALQKDRAFFITSPDARTKFWVDFGFEFQINGNERYAAICYENALDENKKCPSPQKYIYPVVQKAIDSFLSKFYLNLVKSRERECAGNKKMVKNFIVLKNLSSDGLDQLQ